MGEAFGWDDLGGSDPLVFVHIPKTGGTSLANAFRVSLGPDAVSIYTTNAELSAFRAARHYRELTPASVIGGHLSLPDFRAAGLAGWAISVVRDPIDRINSMYRYLSTSEHPDHATLPVRDPAEFMEYLRSTNFYANVQCRMLSGMGSSEAARATLESKIVAVPVERLGELATILSVGLDKPLVVERHNVSSGEGLAIDGGTGDAWDLIGEDKALFDHVALRQDEMMERARDAVARGEIRLVAAPGETGGSADAGQTLPA